MALIVQLPELKDYLGDAPASSDDAVLTNILSDVQALFEAQAGRSAGSFIDAGTARTEVKDGTGSPDLYLDYPVTSLTSVKLGYDSSAPDETLDVSNKLIVNWAAGSRRIARVDGGRFGYPGQSRYVTVVYNNAADIPDSARLGIKSVAAKAYRRKGSEEVKSETVGNFYSVTMLEEIMSADEFWQAAVSASTRYSLA